MRINLITNKPILCFLNNFIRYDHRRAEKHDECGYNQNEGYVVFSAMGSFFIPMAVMVYVYGRISCVVASRHDHMTEIEVHKVIRDTFKTTNTDFFFIPSISIFIDFCVCVKKKIFFFRKI